MIWSIVISGIAGWLAGLIMKGNSFGIIINVILGLLGGAIGNWVFNILGFEHGDQLVPRIITSLVGAIILIWIFSKSRKRD
jgi:uncharacterized membrane protein YeaQ/YmgE (transglycosylase-associated protein family)